jgi:hypothetical protein
MISNENWVIACVDGMKLIGYFQSGKLSPVYELRIEFVMSPKGALHIRHLMPLAGFPSWDTFELPAGCSVQKVSDLSKDDQQQVKKLVEESEAELTKMRARAAGITLDVKP